MARDILFKTDEHIFSYRVGGLPIRDGRILVQRDKSGVHAVIGGHVAFGETAAETLKREFREETGLEVQVDELLAVQENFFAWGNKPCHQVHFYYFVTLPEAALPGGGPYPFYDDKGQVRADLDLLWMSLDDLQKQEFYPKELLPHLLKKPQKIVHFVSNEL